MFIAFLLTISAFSLLFFIISGLFITSKTSWALLKFSINNLNEAKIIILYGSETGSTYQFVKKLLKKLRNGGNKVAICSLNKYKAFPNAEKFIIMTSTYGEGEPPSNANLFELKFKKHKQDKSIDYAVLGFGSKSYPEFCKFAEIINSAVSREKNYFELYPLFKINNQNMSDYLNWEEKICARINSY